MRWRLGRNKGVRLTEQLAEQIRYAIATGQIKPGERLPPGRELAKELGIHANTVFAAYRLLAKEGLISLRQGSGVYVTDFPRDQLKQTAFTSLERTLNALLQPVRLGLMTPEEILDIVSERLRSLKKEAPSLKVAFMECNFEQMEICCQQLEQALGVEVQPILLDDAKQDKNRLRPFDLIVTTFFHFREVKALTAKGQKVVPTLSTPSRRVLEAIASLPRKTRLGVICRDKVSLLTIVQQVHQLSGIEPTLAAWLGDRRGVRQVLTQCDAIVFMPPCRSKVLTAAPKGKTLIEFEHEIDQSSLEEVKRVFEQLMSLTQSDSNCRFERKNAVKVNGG